jgi:hypothetical protein
MTLVVQDVLATSFAALAVLLLVYRIVAVVRPSGGRPPACAACPSACPPPAGPSSGTQSVVPMAALRSGGRPRAASPGTRPHTAH